MTTFCRDVLRTSGMDEFGSGQPSRGFAPVGISDIATGLSLFAGIFASVMIFLAIRGRFAAEDTVRGKGSNNVGFERVATVEIV